MQRHRLLLAMQELVGEIGLAGATVGQVCKRSRVSRRTFYELFGDRDDCFLAALEQALGQVEKRVLPAWERQARWRDRIRAGLEALLGLFDEQRGLARLCILETLTGGPPVLARRKLIVEALAAAVEEGRTEARTGAAGPPPLTGEGTVGGVLAVIHARLQDPNAGPLTDLVPALCGMIVYPYLGATASQIELERPNALKVRARHALDANGHAANDPFRDLPLRFTYRTARVLATIAEHPGASNRHISEDAGMTDQGQISKLLKRLQQAGLIENTGAGRDSGEPNAWHLTTRGQTVNTALGTSNNV
jgi:AcrR family transcriptional regulator